MVTRRDFLGYSAAAFASLMTPARANTLRHDHGDKILNLYNIHTGESLRASYWADGQLQPDELFAINKIMRDHRSKEVTSMDLKLLDFMHAMQQSIGKSGHYEIISAYRSASSNAYLRNSSNGVAKRSLHMRGKAIDVRMTGVDLKHLRQAALRLHAGGVGYYPDSNFIHVDTGRPRFW